MGSCGNNVAMRHPPRFQRVPHPKARDRRARPRPIGCAMMRRLVTSHTRMLRAAIPNAEDDDRRTVVPRARIILPQRFAAVALPPFRPAALCCAVVPPCEALPLPLCDFSPPCFDAFGEFAIFAARSFDMPLSFSASYCLSFLTCADFPGISAPDARCVPRVLPTPNRVKTGIDAAVDAARKMPGSQRSRRHSCEQCWLLWKIGDLNRTSRAASYR